MLTIHLFDLPLKVLFEISMHLARVGLEVIESLLVFCNLVFLGVTLLLHLSGDLELVFIVLVNHVLDLLLFLEQSFVSSVLGVQLDIELSELSLSLILILLKFLLLFSVSRLHILF